MMPTRVCAISFKECWQNKSGKWCSDGGFPLQMGAVGSLFDAMTLLVTQRVKPGCGGIPLPPGAEVIELRRPVGRGWRRKLSVVCQLPLYAQTIARYVGRADVVHLPLPGDMPLIGLCVALLLRKKLLVRYGGSWVKTRTSTMTNRFTKKLLVWFAGGRNVMLATGNGLEPPAPRMRWIFSTALTAQEVKKIVPVTQRALSTPPRLACVGRLSPEKGVHVLIDAFGCLRRDSFQPMPDLLLIGDGLDREALHRRAHQVGCESALVFAGQLDRAAISTALSQVDFCVQPSLTEGYSKAWLDAFVHGLPVLASEVGAAQHVIGRGGERGWMVPPGDARALADRLREVLTNPQDWVALRRRCRQFAEEHTLEMWTSTIGRLCAEQWGIPLRDGKLVLEQR
jgi:glycosyltransferase involved in cell wall biosynthesis